MSIVNNISKIAAAVAGASLVAVSFAPAAFAQTTTTTSTTMTSSQVAALQAEISALEAQLSAAQGGTTVASVTFSRDLTIGSTGSDVTALQTWLIAKGYSIPAGATGYFGTQTQAAVAAYQAANGISPAAGYFGPITRAKVNAAGGTTTTTTTTTGGVTTTTGSTTLTGGEGSIDDLQVLGSPSNTTVYQGQMEQAYGFKFQADGSDLDVNRVDFDFTNTNASVNGGSGQDRPWAVFQTATLYDGSTVIGTLDATNPNNWSQDGTTLVANHQTYRLRFDNLNDVVKMGTQADYYLALTAQNGISTANQTQYQVQLTAQGMRATDAMGLQQYSSASTQNSEVVNVSNATASTVVISTASDNPQTSTVMGNQTSSTQNVVLGTFTLQSQNAATMLYTLPVTLNTSATVPNPIQDLKLVANGTILDSEAITSSQTYASSSLSGGYNAATTVTFKNMNFAIPAGTTQEFQIEADVNPVGGGLTGNAAEGSFAEVQITNSNLTSSDIEQGTNRVSSGSLSGGFTGNQITFHVNGLSVDATPTTSAVESSNGQTTQQIGTFTFTFNVAAFGQDIYISSTTNGFTPATVYNQAGVSTTTQAASITSTADRSTLGNYVVHAGQSKQVTISYTKLGQGGYAYAKLATLLYGTSDSNPLSSSITLPSTYQTQQLYLND